MRKLLFVLGMMSFYANAQWSELGGLNALSANNIIWSVCSDNAGNIHTAGAFTNANGKFYVAKWNGSNWSELGGTNNSTFNNRINSIVVDSFNNVYVAGDFTNSYGYVYVSKWDGNSWSEVGGNNNSIWQNGIYCIAIDNLNNLYAAGNISNSLGINCVAKWNGSNWSELGGTNNSTFNGYISTIKIDSMGNVYVGGLFGKDVNSNFRQYVAKWNGTNWSEVGGINGFIFNERITSLCIDSVGNIYAGGWFKNSNGNNYIAKWNGTSWSEVGGTNTSFFNGSIQSLATDIYNNLYVCGTYTNMSSKFYVAKWNGSVWSELGGTNNSTFNGLLSCINTDNSGNLFVGGIFTNSNNKQYVAKYAPQSLPLKLLSFTAKLQPTPNPSKEGDVLLQWQTANEVNVSYINIQRSNNGKDFTSIGKVNASCCNYSYTDPLTTNHLPLTIFYRLEMVDKDGSKTYSSTQLITINSKLSTLNIYPNPAKDLVTIECAGAKELLIIDYLGKEVYRSSVDSQLLRVNTKQFAKGIYIVKALMNNGNVKTEKLVVE